MLAEKSGDSPLPDHDPAPPLAIDDREGATGRLTGKVADVEKALGRKVSRE